MPRKNTDPYLIAIALIHEVNCQDLGRDLPWTHLGSFGTIWDKRNEKVARFSPRRTPASVWWRAHCWSSPIIPFDCPDWLLFTGLNLCVWEHLGLFGTSFSLFFSCLEAVFVQGRRGEWCNTRVETRERSERRLGLIWDDLGCIWDLFGTHLGFVLG